MTLNNLLFVDDDSGIRGSFKLLSRAYFHLDIDLAESHADALEKIKTTNYDLIIADGLDGKCFDLYADIKNIPHGVFVVYSNDKNIVSKAKILGISAFTKLSDDEQLYSYINNYKKE